MKVSVLLPTRKRVDRCIQAVRSLYEKKRPDTELELLLRLDDDDTESADALRVTFPDAAVLVGPRYTYKELHRYMNELAARATGEWFLIWNDDVVMESDAWDQVIDPVQGQFVYLAPQNQAVYDAHVHGGWEIDQGPNSQFPIIPRQWLDVLGHLSRHCCVDYYCWMVAIEARICRWTLLNFTHAQILDEAYQERFGAPDCQGEYQDFIHQDAARLRAWLDEVKP